MEYNPLRRFVCPDCGKSFKRQQHLERHQRSVHDATRHVCLICRATLSRRDVLISHIRMVHNIANPQPFLPPPVNRPPQQPNPLYGMVLPALVPRAVPAPGTPPRTVPAQPRRPVLAPPRRPVPAPPRRPVLAPPRRPVPAQPRRPVPTPPRRPVSAPPPPPREAPAPSPALCVPAQSHAPVTRPSVIMRAPPRASVSTPIPNQDSQPLPLPTSPEAPSPQPSCSRRVPSPQPSCSTAPYPTAYGSSDEEMVDADPIAIANNDPSPARRRVTCPHCWKVVSSTNLSRHRRFNCSRLRDEPAVEDTPPAQVGMGRRAIHNMSDSEEDPNGPPVLLDNMAPEGFMEVESAFRGRLKTFRLRDQPPTPQAIPVFLGNMLEVLVGLYHHIHQHVRSFKTNLWLDCEFVNVHDDTCRRTFKTKNIPVYRSTDIKQICREMFDKLFNEYEACTMKGSGWVFLRVMDMEIRINVCNSLAGASYIPLPASISCRKAVLNVYNDGDDRCFEYAILSKYLENHDHVRPDHFTPEVRDRANLDFTGLEFPVTIRQISIFERTNGVSVNVYGLDSVFNRKKDRFEDTIFPMHVCRRECPNHFDLLYLTNDDTTHYALITDLEKLIRGQITQRHGRIYVCRRCLSYFDNRPNTKGQTGQQRLEEHRLHCYENAPLRTDLAEKKELKFERHERTQRARFTIYADFECALVPFNAEREPPSTMRAPVGDIAGDRGVPHHHHRPEAGLESARVRTKIVHKPYAYAYYVMDNHRQGQDSNDYNNTFSELRLYRGPDAAQHFMQSIKDDVLTIGNVLYGNQLRVPQLTAGEEATFQAATHCFICKGPFEPTDVKVRDHQHSTPFRFRGAAHQTCNLHFKEQTLVNCYLHNLSNYDAHFIVRELGIDEGDVSVLANTEEKYITFTKRFFYRGAGKHNKMGVRFVDSYRFMSRSLAQLVELLPDNRLRRTRAHFIDPEQYALVHRKGVFPYEYVTSPEVLEEEVLPPPAAFRNTLQMEDIKADDYVHAQRVWRTFECRTLGDYADIYLKTDVLQLADVFEGFRDNCLEHYGLDPAHYLTLPSYAWDVMLYKTKVTLDTLQDVDMYMFFERGIRGGVVQCVTRHAEANNKYTRNRRGAQCDVGVNDREDEREDDTFIMYLDANNLYGWAMSQPLPYKNFEWLSREEIGNLNIAHIGADDQVGYVLEVDLEYPQDRDLQDRHKDLPFCPELRKAPEGQLPYPPEVLHNSSIGKNAKLMTTLLDKQRYVIHYRLLQQALDNGLRVRRIHQVLRFNQKAWLKPYVVMNTELRQLARSKFEEELFKLMVNAVYGMSLQNVRKHLNMKVVTNMEQYNKHVSRANFGDRTWYKENLALLHMLKTKVVLDKPVYAGMCILDHSKWWMYGFHYRMIDRYGLDRIRLIYTDTDSLVYLIRTLDAYRDMLERSEDYDTSNYPRDHPCYSILNAKVLGKFKDEANGVAILEFLGLMSKLYCLLRCGDTDIEEDGPPPMKRAKGVSRAVVKHCLTASDYRRCLREHVVKHTVNTRFQSRHHIMYTVEVTKSSLTPYDDKRYVVPEGGGVSTLPWGHYGIPQAE